jgi:hypothetical protein
LAPGDAPGDAADEAISALAKLAFDGEAEGDEDERPGVLATV